MSETQTQINLQIPRKFEQLLAAKRYRYYVYYGGRGGAKSWSIARILIAMAHTRKLRILCTREYQRSIADSVHKLLRDQIAEMGLAGYFRVTDDKIISLCYGSEFIFRGLHCNATEIKSLEGIDICWIEEAHSTSADSLKYLLPTIRKEGSEVWITFNPDDERDAVYQQFVMTPREDALVTKVNWSDNPYISQVLIDEMRHCERTNPDAYRNIWLGECASISDAIIFAGKYEIRDFDSPATAAYMYGADWGFSVDPTTMLRCYETTDETGRTLWVDWETWGLHVEPDNTPALFAQIPGAAKYPIYADCARPETIDYVRRHGYPLIEKADKWPGSVEDGISYMLGYNKIVIHPRCTHLIDEMHLYRYTLDGAGRPTRKPADKHNHCCDALRYALSRKIRSNTARVIQTTSTSFTW